MPKHIKYFSALSRQKKVTLQLVADTALIVLSFVGAMAFRLESLRFFSDQQVWVAVAIATPVTLFALGFFGLYRSLVRYITGRILLIVGRGALVSAIVLFTAGAFLEANLPRSVPIIYAVFLFLTVGGLRFVVRYLFRHPRQIARMPVIIYGAGEAGLQLLNSLFHGSEYAPVALVDDDSRLHRLDISGLKVSAPSEIPRLVRETGAQMILLAIPSVSRARRREIVSDLEDFQLKIKTIPGMSEIISGRAKISELRTVSAEDLLGRDPVTPDPDLMQQNISGKTVMVSGAGGSIGSELCRQILTQQPEALILYDIAEFALYEIEAELSQIARRTQSTARIIPVLGSVQHANLLEAVIGAYGVQTIFHAAAYKHVPLVEENVVEGIRNNVFGTLAISSAAKKLGVENFTLISTDKAVRPTNIMGATKRISELICQAQAGGRGSTVVSMVRFGNVLGSSGSVIPKFRAQIEGGGPVTVTHTEINRYFMTIPEASQLVIQAGAMAKGGDVFVLDMGEPVRILDLAVSMVRLHGLVPYLVEYPDDVCPEKGDIPICITGLRKGEKLYEELLIGNNPSPTRHPRIKTASEISLTYSELVPFLDRLLAACESFDLPGILKLFHELPIEYSPLADEISDLLWNAAQSSDCKQAIVVKEGQK